MELDLKQLFKRLSDPETKQTCLAELRDNALVLEDSDGKKFKVFKVGKLRFPWFVFARGSDGIRDPCSFSYKKDDIFVMSHPKTGTHWVSNIINLLVRGNDVLNEVTIAPSLIELRTQEDLDALKSPRVLSSHNLPDYLPHEAFVKSRKLILVFRNPKDTAVSMFHHLRQGFLSRGKMEINWDSFIDNFMVGNMPPCSFHDYYNIWQEFIEHHKDLDILVVHYEDLKKNAAEEIHKIQTYLGLSHSDETLKRIAEKCSIDNLRSDVNDKIIFSILVDKDGKSVIFRKGIVGDWKNMFTVAQSERMDALSEAKFQNSVFKWRNEN